MPSSYTISLSSLGQESKIMEQLDRIDTAVGPMGPKLIKIKFVEPKSRLCISFHPYHTREEMVEEGKKKSNMMGFRAECLADVLSFAFQLWSCPTHKKTIMAIVPDERGIPDVDVVMQSRMSESDLLDVMRQVGDDAHIMLQTLNPLATYTGERDYDRE